MIRNPIKISTKTKIVIVATTAAAAGFYLGTKYSTRSYTVVAEEGVNNWLREMADSGLSMLVLNKETVEKMFNNAQEIALEVAP